MGRQGNLKYIVFYLFLFLFLLDSFPLYSSVLHKKGAEGICGTPLFWNKENEVGTVKRLGKPIEADTTFFIRDDVFKTPADLIEVPFYKVITNDTVDIYVEKEQWENGNVTQEDIEDFIKYILHKTPEGSINQNMGIIPNEYSIFGTPSDKDKNGKILILMIDVRDNYVEGVSETYVAGYFDPLDMDPNKGNYGEIIYVDTYPSHPESFFTLSIIAHELQHLIHYNYDPDEDDWLNEGLSVLIPRLLGLPSRSYSTFLSSPNRSLTEFDNSLLDYSKVGLFMFYVYRQFGAGILKKIVKATENSISSIESVLKAEGYLLSKEELLLRWFIANLINNPAIYGGIYSYMGESIPMLYTDHFHSSFNDDPILGELNRAAAEYIQFYSGSEIKFDFQYDKKELIDLAVVRDLSGAPEIEFVQPCPEHYHFEDENFGKDYTTVTFIPFRTVVASPYDKIDFSYTSSGREEYEEFEVSYDRDSLKFYIQLKINEDPIEACERFNIEDPEWRLKAIKMRMSSEFPVTVKVYNGTGTEMLFQEDNITPSVNAWTRVEVGRLTFGEDVHSILVGIYSPDNALGYTDAVDGTGKAFIKYGESLYNLSDFGVGEEDNKQVLTGNWLIRAVFERKIVIPASISITPDTLYFCDEKTDGIVTLENDGTEPLMWKIESENDWLYFEPDTGVTIGTSEIVVSVDMNAIDPGIYITDVVINSNAGKDTLVINVLKRNPSFPQAAILPFCKTVTDTSLTIDIEVVNIGIGESPFSFYSEDHSVSFYPQNGSVGINDTISVKMFFNRYLATTRDPEIFFYNGVDTESVVLHYEGEIESKLEELKIYAPFSNPFLVGKQGRIFIPVKIQAEKEARVFIYNLLGELVREFRITNEGGESLLLAWDGRNNRGKLVSTGVYFVVLKQGNKIAKTKILLLK